MVPGGEGTIQLELSDSAINRIRCPEKMSSIIYAEYKPVDIKTRGQDVHLSVY